MNASNEPLAEETADTGPPLTLSVVDPLADVFSHMGAVLFKPFRARTWFGLGFILFMTTNVLNFVFIIGFQILANGIPLFFDRRFDHGPAVDWYFANLLLFWSLLIGGLLVFGVVLTLLSWLRSRAIMMFLHGVARGSGNVPEAWRSSRIPGNSLFLWRILISTAVLVGVLVAVVVLWIGTLTAGGGGAESATGTESIGSVIPIWAIVVSILIALLSLIIGVLINAVVDLVVVPAMAVRGTPMRETWHDLRTDLMPGRFWLFVGFALFQIPLQMGSNFAIQVIVLLTCMLAVLPYLGSVLLLPAVFPLVAYQLGFYQQFGAGWQSLPIKAAPPDIVGGKAPPTTPIAPAEPGEGDSTVE